MEILAAHGFTGTGSDFEPLVKTIKASWLTPDLPGHATAAHLDCSIHSMVQFIDIQARKLEGQSNILCGYSMGARAALLHALRQPTKWRALILISVNPGIRDEDSRNTRRREDHELAKKIEREGVQSFLKYWQSTPMIRTQSSIPSQSLRKMQENRKNHTAIGLSNSLRQFGQGSFPDLWDQLNTLTMPILCLSGANDIKYTSIATQISRQVDSAQSICIEAAGHMPHLENTLDSAVAINSFLRQLH